MNFWDNYKLNDEILELKIFLLRAYRNELVWSQNLSQKCWPEYSRWFAALLFRILQFLAC